MTIVIKALYKPEYHIIRRNEKVLQLRCRDARWRQRRASGPNTWHVGALLAVDKLYILVISYYFLMIKNNAVKIRQLCMKLTVTCYQNTY